MRQTMTLGPCVLFSMSLRLVVGGDAGTRPRRPPIPWASSRKDSSSEGVALPTTPSTRRALVSFTPWRRRRRGRVGRIKKALLVGHIP